MGKKINTIFCAQKNSLSGHMDFGRGQEQLCEIVPAPEGDAV